MIRTAVTFILSVFVVSVTAVVFVFLQSLAPTRAAGA
jgi:hypothetical protein